MSIGKHSINQWEAVIPVSAWLILASGALSSARLIIRAGTPTPRLLHFSMKMAARCSRAGLVAWQHQNRHHRS